MQEAQAAEERAADAEIERDDLIEKCRLLEVENAVAVEQLSRSGLFNNGTPAEHKTGLSWKKKKTTQPGTNSEAPNATRADLPPRPSSINTDRGHVGGQQGLARGGRSPIRQSERVTGETMRSDARGHRILRDNVMPRASSPHRHGLKDRNATRHVSPQRDSLGNVKPPQPNLVADMVAGLKHKFEENGLTLPLEEISHEVYRLGNRRLSLKVQNGRLVVRVGGGFCDLIEFLEKVRIP